MISDRNIIGQSEVTAELAQILGALGQGKVNSVAYDTAWAARLSNLYAGRGFGESLAWLRQHQRGDGSWGGDVLHYHDRFICTLASAITLHTMGFGSEDADRVRHAVEFLWREHLRLRQDAHETIGFSVLAVSLIEEARVLGLDVPLNPYCDTQTVARKLSILESSPHLWRNSTMSFSLEAIRACFPNNPDFMEANGSVGTSPAATASLLLRSDGVSQKALDYLLSVMEQDGGVPNVSPIDTFEMAWSLNYLRCAGAVSPDDPAVRHVLDRLWSMWSNKRGMGFSSYYSVPNLDDTAVSYAVLRWAGYPVQTDVFATFEEEDHFRCFVGEIDFSVSAALRLVDALKMDPNHPKHEAWMEKAVGMLRRSHRDGTVWFDKWHSSPYYLLCNSVQALRGVADDLATSQLHWVTASQNDDGGWGYYGESTLEETAYALLALFNWDQYAGRVEPESIRAGGEFLTARFQNPKLTPLWLGKCLYTPEWVVRAIIVAALHRYFEWSAS